jgi:hypothetical protein
MWKILLGIVVCILVYSSENARFQHAYHDCLEQNAVDLELTNRDVCTNHEDRLMFKDSINCEGAERRLRMSVHTCTFYNWASESNISQLYHRLTGNYWALLGVIIPLVGIYMYLWNMRKMQNDMFGGFKEMAKKLKGSKRRRNDLVAYRE